MGLIKGNKTSFWKLKSNGENLYPFILNSNLKLIQISEHVQKFILQRFYSIFEIIYFKCPQEI